MREAHSEPPSKSRPQPLEQLFSSKARVKLLSLFLRNYQSEFYVRELTRKLKEQINSVRRELLNLEEIDLVSSKDRDRKKYYTVNTAHPLFKELRALFLKAQATPKEILGQRLQKVGRVTYAALSGFFTESNSKVDMVIVGEVDRAKLREFMDQLEEEQGREVNYTVMPSSEFTYRRDLKDRFLLSVLDGKHITFVDELERMKAASAAPAGTLS